VKRWWARRRPETDLRRRIAEIIQAVGVPRPLHIEQFTRTVADYRGRNIHLIPMGDNLPVSGLCLALPGADFLVYRESVSRLQETATILHELGHLLLGHTGTAKVDGIELAVLRMLTPDLDPDAIDKVFARSCASGEDDEDAAEQFAREVWMHADHLLAPAPPDGTANASGLQELTRILGPAR
jgi:hypothetical protein